MVTIKLNVLILTFKFVENHAYDAKINSTPKRTINTFVTLGLICLVIVTTEEIDSGISVGSDIDNEELPKTE